ncbi:MAG: hypothetical protein AB1758_25550 [Candidatus Eremiobacterota bacterium]
MRYFRTRHYIPTRGGEAVTCYETDDELLVLRHVTLLPREELPRRTDSRQRPLFRLQEGPRLEPIPAEEFWNLWNSVASE